MLHDALVNHCEQCFLLVAEQIDALLDDAAFYLERFPSSYHATEVRNTVEIIAERIRELAEVIKLLRRNYRVLSVEGVEISILNELWIHVSTLVNLLIEAGVDLDRYDHVKMHAMFREIVASNRSLT